MAAPTIRPFRTPSITSPSDVPAFSPSRALETYLSSRMTELVPQRWSNSLFLRRRSSMSFSLASGKIQRIQAVREMPRVGSHYPRMVTIVKRGNRFTLPTEDCLQNESRRNRLKSRAGYPCGISHSTDSMRAAMRRVRIPRIWFSNQRRKMK